MPLTSGGPLSFDVYAQGIQALRRTGVLGDLRSGVRTVVAAGLYPDRRTYLAQFSHAVARNVRDGYVLPADVSHPAVHPAPA